MTSASTLNAVQYFSIQRPNLSEFSYAYTHAHTVSR